MSAIVGLGPVGRAAVGVKTNGIRIGVQPEDVDLGKSRIPEPLSDIACQIEMRLLVGGLGKEAPVRRIGRHETVEEGRVDFVGLLRDAGADNGVDPVAAGAELLHRRHGRVRYAGDRTPPSGMRCSDDSRFGVGEQHRRAVCREDAEKKPGSVRHHCISVRSGVPRPGSLDVNRVSRMNLMNRGEVGVGKHRGDCAASVLLDRRPVVSAAETDVQSFKLAGRNASASAEKAVWNVAKRCGANDVDPAQSTFRMMMSSSA